MAKANAEATVERVDHLQGMILAGEPNTACLTLRDKHGGCHAPGLPAAEESLATDQERHR